MGGGVIYGRVGLVRALEQHSSGRAVGGRAKLDYSALSAYRVGRPWKYERGLGKARRSVRKGEIDLGADTDRDAARYAQPVSFVMGV